MNLKTCPHPLTNRVSRLCYHPQTLLSYLETFSQFLVTKNRSLLQSRQFATRCRSGLSPLSISLSYPTWILCMHLIIHLTSGDIFTVVLLPGLKGTSVPPCARTLVAMVTFNNRRLQCVMLWWADTSLVVCVVHASSFASGSGVM